MMNNAWSSIEQVSYCFSRSSVKFQGHTALKIVEFDPNWAFPECNCTLNLPMATKLCKKLKVALKRCPLVFRGHHQISRSHGLKNRRFESNLSKITGPVAVIKSLRFALFIISRQAIKIEYQFIGSVIGIVLLQVQGSATQNTLSSSAYIFAGVITHD